MPPLMKKFSFALTLGLLVASGAGSARADEALRHVQQSLRDQGFYYGTIDGAPGDETTHAIRRYQIRNGLAVTGQLNDETIKSIDRNESSVTKPGGSPGSSGRITGDNSRPGSSSGIDEDRRYAQGAADGPAQSRPSPAPPIVHRRPPVRTPAATTTPTGRTMPRRPVRCLTARTCVSRRPTGTCRVTGSRLRPR